jgi:hypothetical protein
MSGSAVYILAGEREFFLAGFMYEASKEETVMIPVSHADHINADGTLRGLH